ncbi:Very long-chain specific acyl-CoA dehydrogenase, mitochondrial [Triplophysa tibetana]|uniref:Very long-chain specific acyl-CoA dehydrogenase, mitochondrial n=1 Tax=Triplophysa tibetana TaxID=1572043 RepID=A0A5A9PMP2_9TELE|nr:Very long-chain specific acyl-CoA dehydrogenase, mitochondrial [Triplophysa tibetana]
MAVVLSGTKKGVISKVDAGVEKIMMDLRIFRNFEGTNDILRLFVALNSFQNAGIQLKSMQKALYNPFGNAAMLAVRHAWGQVEQGKVHPELNHSGELGHQRVMEDVKFFRSETSKQIFKNLRAVSAAMVENGGVVSPHPLGF